MSGEPSMRLTVPSGMTLATATSGAGSVEPRAGGDPPTRKATGSGRFWHRGGQVGVFLGCLQNFDHADAPVGRAGDLATAFLTGVLETEFDGVDFQLLAKLVDGLLGGEGGGWRTGSAVGCGLGNVGNHVISLYESVGDIVGTEHGAATAGNRRTRERAGLVDKGGGGGGEAPVSSAAHLDPDFAARGGAGASEDLGTAHGDLDGAAGLAGEGCYDGFEITAALTLAAESAADLHGDDVDLTDRYAEDAAGMVTQGKVALTAGPDGDGVVGVPACSRRVRLDVALVDLSGLCIRARRWRRLRRNRLPDRRARK